MSSSPLATSLPVSGMDSLPCFAASAAAMAFGCVSSVGDGSVALGGGPGGGCGRSTVCGGGSGNPGSPSKISRFFGPPPPVAFGVVPFVAGP